MRKVLLSERFFDNIDNRLIIIIFFIKHLLQIYFSIVKEANFQVPVCCESNSITSTAEVLTHAAYVAKLALITLNAVAFRSRACSFICYLLDCQNSVVFLNDLMHLCH